MKKHFAAVAIAFAIASTAPAHAALVTLDFTATNGIAGSLGNTGIAAGPFSGSLTYDTSVAGNPALSGVFQYTGAIKSLTLGPNTYDVSSWAVNDISVIVDAGSALPSSGFGFHLTFTPTSPGGPVVPTFNLNLISANTALVTSFALPVSFPGVSAFDRSHSINFMDLSGGGLDLVTSIGVASSAVAEPSSFMLFGTTVLALCYLARRSRASAPST